MFRLLITTATWGVTTQECVRNVCGICAIHVCGMCALHVCNMCLAGVQYVSYMCGYTFGWIVEISKLHRPRNNLLCILCTSSTCIFFPLLCVYWKGYWFVALVGSYVYALYFHFVFCRISTLTRRSRYWEKTFMASMYPTIPVSNNTTCTTSIIMHIIISYLLFMEVQL